MQGVGYNGNGPNQNEVQYYYTLPPSSFAQRILTNTLVAILVVCGLVVICIQAYVYSNFTQVYDYSSLPSTTFAENWPEFYTAMILSSGSANVIIGFFLYCILRTWKKSMMITGAVFTVFTATASTLAGLSAVAELIKLYDESESPPHVCVATGNIIIQPLTSDCNTWWWLELVVVIFSGLALIANFTCFIVLCIDLCSGNFGVKITQPVRETINGDVKETWPAYDEISQPSTIEPWIPRIPNSLPKSDSFLESQLNYSIVHSRQQQQPVIRSNNNKNRAPPRPTPLQSRPSLPIVIRERTSSRYFY